LEKFIIIKRKEKPSLTKEFAECERRDSEEDKRDEVNRIVWTCKEGIENIPFLDVAFMSGRNIFTHIPLADTPVFHSRYHEFYFHSESQPFSVLFGHCLEVCLLCQKHFLLITSNYYKLTNAPYAVECSEHKVNTDIYLSVKNVQQWIYTEQNAACRLLTHISSQTRKQFFLHFA